MVSFDLIVNAVQADTARFLLKYPPFSYLPKEELVDFINQLEVRFYKKDAFIFNQQKPTQGEIYIVKNGAVTLNQDEVVIDVCDTGDIFGVRSALAGNDYLVSSRCTENTLLYVSNGEKFKKLLNDHPVVNDFFLKGLASGLPVLTSVQESTDKQEPNSLFGLAKLNDLSLVETSNEVVFCSPDATISSAAKLMKDKRIGSILILDDYKKPIGILTDSDFRKKVVAEELPYTTSVSAVMTTPVACIKPMPSVTEVLMTFIKGGYHHVCVTEDGTEESKAIGVISNHDVLLERGDHPGILLKEIRGASSLDSLVSSRKRFQVFLTDFIKQGVSMSYLSELTTLINDALLDRCSQILSQESGIDLSNLAWINLGSEGRKEQLLQTDLDNGLIFMLNEGEDLESSRKVYLDFAEKVIDFLVQCGFVRCPADMMASNRRWCLSLDEWGQLFTDWITTPTNENILHGNIFFDYRFVFGNEDLTNTLTETIFGQIKKNDLFLRLMAKSALQNPPPLSFFRNFIVETDGSQKDKFDIKARSLMPLIDGARLLALHNQLAKLNSTYSRYGKLSEVSGPERKLYGECKEAFMYLLTIRTQHGIRNNDSGRYVRIQDLTKIERQTLRNIFKTITALQDHLKLKFQLTSF